jgi:hypothetical protein
MCCNFQKNIYSDIYLKKYSWGNKNEKENEQSRFENR